MYCYYYSSIDMEKAATAMTPGSSSSSNAENVALADIAPGRDTEKTTTLESDTKKKATTPHGTIARLLLAEHNGRIITKQQTNTSNSFILSSRRYGRGGGDDDDDGGSNNDSGNINNINNSRIKNWENDEEHGIIEQSFLLLDTNSTASHAAGLEADGTGRPVPTTSRPVRKYSELSFRLSATSQPTHHSSCLSTLVVLSFLHNRRLPRRTHPPATALLPTMTQW